MLAKVNDIKVKGLFSLNKYIARLYHNQIMSKTLFQKGGMGGGLKRTLILRGGCRNRGDNFFQGGGGVAIFTK